MKTISIAIIKGIFGMFIACFKQVQSLSKTDKPWQEWLIFLFFMALTFAVLWFGFHETVQFLMSDNAKTVTEAVAK